MRTVRKLNFKMAVSLSVHQLRRTLSTSSLRGSLTALSIYASSKKVMHPQSSMEQLHCHRGPYAKSRINTRKSELTVEHLEKDCNLSEIFASKLSLSPKELNLTKEYVLPSISPFSTTINILDPSHQLQIRDCPTNNVMKIIELPLEDKTKRIETPNIQPKVEKHAKRILKIRRRKMKKHQYRKWQKRNKFRLRALLLKRQKKKQKLWEEHLDLHRFKGLTPEYTDWYMSVKREEQAVFLKHLGIEMERETPESLEEKEERQKRREKKITRWYNPEGTMKIYPEPILPEGSSLKKLFKDQEENPKEWIAKLNEQR